jgi:hypothetical protein
MTAETSKLLDRIRKLLAKSEAQGTTPPEAEALTAKAAELMARYGIDRALLAAAQPATARPASRIIDIPNPWSAVRAHLLSGLATAMRCQCVLLTPERSGSRVHVFGYASDLERADLLYTSLLLQMAHALAAAPVPGGVRSMRAWRRSWLLGFTSAVIARVAEAENRAAAGPGAAPATGPGTALVLADRALVVRREVEQAYPVTRRARVTFTGTGYQDGYRKGGTADIGGTRISRPGAPALPSSVR